MRRFVLMIVGFLGACGAAVLLLHRVSGVGWKPQQTLPLPVEGTSLVVQQFVRYEGAFLEDGGGEEVSDVAAILVCNTSDTGIAFAEVRIEQLEKTRTFQLSHLPAGGRVLVLEKNAQSYLGEAITSCHGTMVQEEDGWEIEAYCILEPIGMGSIRITNISNLPLLDAELYYKSYYPENEFYLGGITYRTEIGALAPGEQRILYPKYYALGYTGFVRLKVQNDSPLKGEGNGFIEPWRENPAICDAGGG